MRFFVVLTQLLYFSSFAQSTVNCSSLQAFEHRYQRTDNKIALVRNIARKDPCLTGCKQEFFIILNLLCDKSYDEKEYDLFKELATLQLNLAQEANYSKEHFKGAFNLGSYFLVKSTYDSAYYYFSQAAQGYKIIGDSVRAGENVLNMAIIRLNTGSFYESQKLSTEALVLLEPFGSQQNLLSIYNNLGISCNELEQYKEAVKWYRKALLLSLTPIEKLVLLNNIGIVFRNTEEYDKALDYFEKAKAVRATDEFPSYEAMVEDNIAYTRFLMGDYSVEEELKAAYFKRKGSKRGMAVSLLHIAEFLSHTQRIDSSLFYATKSLEIAGSIGDVKNQRKALRFLISLEPNRELNEKYFALEDDFDRTDRSMEHKFALIDYQTQKKESENLTLKSENATQQQAIAESQSEITVQYAVIAILCLATGFIFVFLRQRKKIYHKTLMFEKLKEREIERDRISLHIHEEVGSELLLALQKAENLVENRGEGIEKIIWHTDRAYTTLRQISQELHPPDFSKVSFKQHIHYMIADFVIEGTLLIHCNDLTKIDDKKANPIIKKEILSILKEAFTNIRKHAKATRVDLQIAATSDKFLVEIKDDGKGMDSLTNKGVGIEHMQKRVNALDGHLVIHSPKEGGTLVRFEIPIL